MPGLTTISDAYERRSLLQIGEVLRTPETAFMKNFFKLEERYATSAVDVDLVKHADKLYAYVNRFEQGQTVAKDGYTTSTFEPPYLKPKIPITPGDLRKRIPGESLYTTSGTLQPQVSAFIAKQMVKLKDGITRNHELQAVQAVINGEVKCYDENNELIATLNYQRTAALQASGVTAWTAGKLAAIKARRRLVKSSSGYLPRVCILGIDAADAFQDDTNVQKAVSKDWSSRGQLGYNLQDDGFVWLGMVDGIDFYTYEEQYTDPADNTRKYMVPEKYAVLASPDAPATRAYAAIEVMDSLEAAAMFPDVYPNPQRDPSGTIVQLHSAGLMITNNPDAYAGFQVIA